MVPKYVFLFIGDGMSYPQIQATAYFNGAQQRGEESTIERVSFMDFPVIGSQYTYDSTSFCPDSASTATSIASGRKTASGVINVSPDASERFETIAEKLKRQLGYKVGVLTSVNLNHAMPAAFYAHQQSRKNYCEIGQELIASGFDYFAGGGLLNPTGASDNRIDLYEAARDAGYEVARTYDEGAAQVAEAETGSLMLTACEDEQLREAWEMKEEYPDRQIVNANVIGRDPLEKYYSFTIDKGERHGVIRPLRHLRALYRNAHAPAQPQVGRRFLYLRPFGSHRARVRPRRRCRSFRWLLRQYRDLREASRADWRRLGCSVTLHLFSPLFACYTARMTV